MISRRELTVGALGVGATALKASSLLLFHSCLTLPSQMEANNFTWLLLKNRIFVTVGCNYAKFNLNVSSKKLFIVKISNLYPTIFNEPLICIHYVAWCQKRYLFIIWSSNEGRRGRVLKMQHGWLLVAKRCYNCRDGNKSWLRQKKKKEKS